MRWVEEEQQRRKQEEYLVEGMASFLSREATPEEKMQRMEAFMTESEFSMGQAAADLRERVYLLMAES